MTTIGRSAVSPFTVPLVQQQVLAQTLAVEAQLVQAALSSLQLSAPEMEVAARSLLAMQGVQFNAGLGSTPAASNVFSALAAQDPRAALAANQLLGPLPSTAYDTPAELNRGLDALYGPGAAALVGSLQVAQQQGVLGLLAVLSGATTQQVAQMLGGGATGLDAARKLSTLGQALMDPTSTPASLGDVALAAELALAKHSVRGDRSAQKQLRQLLQGHEGIGRGGFSGGAYTGQGSLGNVVAQRRPDATEPAAGAFRADRPSAAGGMALEAARSQVGVREATGNNDGLPAQRFSNGRREPWCANFVAWSFRQSGHPLPGNQRSLASVQYMEDQMKAAGRFTPRNQAQPRPGDIIFFSNRGDSDRGGGRHVGIVDRVENGRVYTIEGNSGNQVARRSYPLGATRISGYGHA
jgi:hypothetical protein